MSVTITCPACANGKISFDPRMLAMGKSFSCIKCGAGVTISEESSTTLSNALDELEKIKQGGTIKTDHPLS